MNLSEAKRLLEAIEPQLADAPFVIAHTFERNGRKLHLGITGRLRRAAKRGRVWKSSAFLTTLKNAEYGFDETRARSAGSSDGIFLLDRDFIPSNEMMRKIFGKFLDKADGEAAAIARLLNTRAETLRAVRLVSHHVRLLGVLHSEAAEDWLILVDFDDTNKYLR